MRKEEARDHYLGREGRKKLNCAQAIIKACHGLFGGAAPDVDAFASCGGGRAPEGLCGAYYAARYLIDEKDPALAARLEREFAAAAGSLKCKEIRALRRLTCLGCVEKAADILDGEGND